MALNKFETYLFIIYFNSNFVLNMALTKLET
jgi:hypothetical protein